MSEDVLKQFPLAMTIDSETGKPMMKVSTTGGSSGGGSPMTFPEDFPDEALGSMLQQHISKYNTDMTAFKNILGAIGESIQNTEDHIEGIAKGITKIRVVIETTEGS